LTETSRQGSGDDITLGLIKSFIEEEIDLAASAQTQLAQDLAALDAEIKAGLIAKPSQKHSHENDRTKPDDRYRSRNNSMSWRMMS
jgi:hypothetical protein